MFPLYDILRVINYNRLSQQLADTLLSTGKVY